MSELVAPKSVRALAEILDSEFLEASDQAFIQSRGRVRMFRSRNSVGVWLRIKAWYCADSNPSPPHSHGWVRGATRVHAGASTRHKFAAYRNAVASTASYCLSPVVSGSANSLSGMLLPSLSISLATASVSQRTARSLLPAARASRTSSAACGAVIKCGRAVMHPIVGTKC